MIGVCEFLFVYNSSSHCWDCLLGVDEQGGWWGFVVHAGRIVLLDAFLGVHFVFCEGRGGCTVAAKFS